MNIFEEAFSNFRLREIDTFSKNFFEFSPAGDGSVQVYDDSDDFLLRFIKACDGDPEKSFQLVRSS